MDGSSVETTEAVGGRFAGGGPAAGTARATAGDGMPDAAALRRALVTCLHLALAETRSRYARSTIGPLWVTVQASVFVGVVGAVVSEVFKQDFGTFFSWFSASFVLWGFLSSTVIDATQVYQSVSGLIKDRAVAPTVFFFLPIARQSIVLMHTIWIPVAVIAVSGTVSPLGLLMAIPGFLLFVLACFLLSLLIAVRGVRFHDARPILESGMQILFLVSPILWPSDVLQRGTPLLVQLNPVTQLMAVWREPLFHQTVPWASVGYVAVLIALLLFALRRVGTEARRLAMWL